jgi:acetyl esterase/lipase
MLAAGLALSGASAAAAEARPPSSFTTGTEPDEVFDLWPRRAPGGANVTVRQEVVERTNPFNLRDRAVTGVTRPTLSLFRPARPDGSAVLIIPGGGYRHVVVDKEGYECARWLAARGALVFVLLYRLPHHGWAAGSDTPLQDAQRAMRLIHARAERYGVDRARIAVQGFSAGGHLAATLATRWDAPIAPGRDDIDALPARPGYCGLIYPVITMQNEHAHPGSRENLIGASPSAERIAAYSAENGARPDMPPVFLLHAADDMSVPVANSLLMFNAVKRASVHAELHVFDEGGHGFGLRGIDDKPARTWPELFWNFGSRIGVFGAG